MITFGDIAYAPGLPGGGGKIGFNGQIPKMVISQPDRIPGFSMSFIDFATIHSGYPFL